MGVAQKHRQRFIDRFAPHGDGFVYRAGASRPGFAVSAAERDDFLRACDARITAWKWVLNPWVFYGAIALAVVVTTRSTSVAGVPFIAVCIVGLLYATCRLIAFDGLDDSLKHDRVDAGLPKREPERPSVARVVWGAAVTAMFLFEIYQDDGQNPTMRVIGLVLCALVLMHRLYVLIQKGMEAL